MITYEQMSSIVQIGLQVWFIALFMIILLHILQGKISLVGVFQQQKQKTQLVVPERVALTVVTIGLLFFYFLEGMSSGCASDTKVCSLPDMPEGLLSVFGGVNATYIAGKIVRKGQAGGRND